MSQPGYTLDVSSDSCVVVCRQCGWRALVLDRLAGRRQAASHERRAHPGQTLASKALSTALARVSP